MSMGRGWNDTDWKTKAFGEKPVPMPLRPGPSLNLPTSLS